MITEKEYLNALDLIKRYRLQKQSQPITRETGIHECGLDVRVLNILSQVANDYGITPDSKGNIKVGDFEGFTKRDFVMYPGVGAKTLSIIEGIFLEVEMEFKSFELDPKKKKQKILVQSSEIRSPFLN